MKGQDSRGNDIQLRALLDSESQASFITDCKANSLKLQRRTGQATITGLGAHKRFEKTSGIDPVILNADIEAILYILPKITSCVPTEQLDISEIRHNHNLQLADPEFRIPAGIDILWGAEEVMLESRIKDTEVIIRKTLFGWIVSG